MLISRISFTFIHSNTPASPMFRIEDTKTTPLIDIQPGKILIKGRSIPEDSAAFYNPVLEACKEYTGSPVAETEILIHLDYVNSGSKKFLTNILTILEKSHLEGHGYKIRWKFDEDDEAMRDLGNDLQSIIQIPMELIRLDG